AGLVAAAADAATVRRVVFLRGGADGFGVLAGGARAARGKSARGRDADAARTVAESRLGVLDCWRSAAGNDLVRRGDHSGGAGVAVLAAERKESGIRGQESEMRSAVAARLLGAAGLLRNNAGL